jgi:hypothetical protein
MPKLPPNKADKNNRQRKHVDKKFISSGTSTDWSDGNIKLCNDAENIHKGSKIAPPDTEDSFEGKIVNVLVLRESPLHRSASSLSLLHQVLRQSFLI